jgi:crotonobetainyl-CoA:carnitine CoA-transferase CaiB-like acyl-CoA transferase
MTGALSNLSVLDLSRVLAGPWASRHWFSIIFAITV